MQQTLILLAALGTLLFKPLQDRAHLWLKLHTSPSGVSVSVERDLCRYPDLKSLAPEQFYLLGRDRDSLDYSGDDWAEWMQWVRDSGGIDVGHSAVLITVQALQDAAIVIDPPILNWRRLGVPPGQAISPDGLGGGPLSARHYAFSIQGESVSREYSDPDVKEVRSPSFTLQNGDSERLLVLVYVDEGMAKWSLDLPMIVNGRKVAETVTDGGQDFTTIGGTGLHFMLWFGGGWIPSASY